MATSTATSGPSTKLTRLDRRLQIILDNPDQTASRNDAISSQIERLHRLHGTSLIYESSQQLSLGASTYATSCVIFHRFYHQVSLSTYDVWSVAMASTLLATKIEEEPKTIKQIIDVYAQIYAKRLILADLVKCKDDDDATPVSDDNIILQHPCLAHILNEVLENSSNFKNIKEVYTFCISQQRQQQSQYPTLNKYGPVYKEWYEQITKMESIVLRQLGFTVYWISDFHPHKFILYFCQVLELKDIPLFVQNAWNYCNDSYRLDLCVRYTPEVIASSAILLAAKDANITLPMKPCPWWQIFLGKNSKEAQNLVNAANFILGLRTISDESKIIVCNGHFSKVVHDKASSIDWIIASYGFVRSLVKRNVDNDTAAFNDANSFLWEVQKDSIQRNIDDNDK